MFDNYDPDMAKKSALAMLIFCIALCLILVCANLFAGAAIAWKWVFAPIWIPWVLGIILMVLGIKPPGQ